MYEILFFSLVLGSCYALMTAGFNLLLGVARIINLAYGAYMALVAYLYSGFSESMPVPIAAALAMAISVALGTFGWIILRFIRRDEVLMIVVSLAIALLIEGALIWGYGPYQRVVPALVSGSLGWVSAQWLLAILVSVAVLAGYYIIIGRTIIGKKMVAIAENADLALMMGINPAKVYLFTTFLASLFASLASLMISPFLTVSPQVAWLYLTIVLSVSIVGGLGSVGGSLIAAFLISFAERFSAYYLDPSVEPFVPLLLIILVLLFRPQGILGRGATRWA